MSVNYPVRKIPDDMPENILTQRIIKCAIEVHKQLGPGLLENVYENALTVEFELNGLAFAQQVQIPIVYSRSEER